MRTFDVFETALVRRVGVPSSVFLLLGAQEDVARLTGLDATTFADLREWCERDQRRTHPSREIPLAQVYRALVRDLELDPSAVATLVEAELALEARLLVPNPLQRGAIEEARRTHGKVIWLSDTYVPSEWLVAQLRGHGLLADGDALYVSNEHLASKVMGDLYPLVARETGTEAGRFEHTGNDPESDVANARAAGWRARLAPDANPGPHELALEAAAGKSSGLSSLMAGASILSRLRAAPAGSGGDLQMVGASVGGPALASFALWLLVRAVELRLDRIYFVARDGELPLRLARALQPLVPGAADLELRYLHGSRQAWHLPSADLEPERIAGWLRPGAREASLRELLARLRLGPEDAGPLAAAADAEARLGDDADRLIDRLLADEGFMERVRTAAGSARETLLAYLRQEGLLDDKRYACVELGWHGRAARSLDLVLRSAGHPGAVRYQFFGLYFAAGPDGAPEKAEAFFRDFREAGKVSDPVLYFLEAFCAGLEGRTAEIQRAGDRYEPVLAEPRNEVAIGWGLPQVYEALEHFAETLADGLRAAPGVVTKPNVLALREPIDSIFEAVWAAPTSEEARVLGSIPLKGSIVYEGSQTLARPLRWSDVPVGLRRHIHYTGFGWEGASMRLTPPPVRRAVAATWRLRALASRMRR